MKKRITVKYHTNGQMFFYQQKVITFNSTEDFHAWEFKNAKAIWIFSVSGL
jgi:hypothetical protein